MGFKGGQGLSWHSASEIPNFNDGIITARNQKFIYSIEQESSWGYLMTRKFCVRYKKINNDWIKIENGLKSYG